MQLGAFSSLPGAFRCSKGLFSLQLGDFLVALRRQLAPARISWQDSGLLQRGAKTKHPSELGKRKAPIAVSLQIRCSKGKSRWQ